MRMPMDRLSMAIAMAIPMPLSVRVHSFTR